MMTTAGQQENRVHPEEVYRIDPRLILMMAVVFIAVVFTTFSWAGLLVLSGSALTLLYYLGCVETFRQRLYWLRWFLLFILFIHLLLSTGHTLFGLSWLSRDGLLHGLLISVQIVTALAFSLALSHLVSPERLAAAAASLLRPLSMAGFNVQGFVNQAVIALNFAPVLKEEGRKILQENEAVIGEVESRGLTGRLLALQSRVSPLLISLADRADAMAHDAAADRDYPPAAEKLPAFWPLARQENVAVIIALLLLLVVWTLP